MGDADTLTWLVRAAGVLHFVTLAFACATPIPPDWERNLARLPLTHRRFAVAQNASIGGVIAFCGFACVCFAPALLDGSALARLLCAGIAAWWGGRLLVLPWLRVREHLRTRWLRAGFRLLQLQCATYALTFGWLASRG